MNFLEAILAHKREEIDARKKVVSRSQLEDSSRFERTPISLAGVLRDRQLAVIAELKKASPSRNVIRNNFDPITIAQEYVTAGASALSVLTDSRYFQGQLSYIERLRDQVSVPLLRKDFIVDSYQLYESKACGADAVLLIVAALERDQLIDLKNESEELGMECLVEVHKEEEIALLDGEDVDLIGINNRDLVTFETDLSTSFRLKQYIPSGVITVSESGIGTAKDIEQLMSCGIHAVLIGESFMRAESPGKALSDLLKHVQGVRR